MFCPKCGNQLPDGAYFCSACGSPVNMQPVTPDMPAEPVVTATPAMPAEPVVTAEPVMPVEPVVTAAPVMPTQQATPTFIPAQPMPQNLAIAPAKKSKAPLFIGLGIGALVIAIVAIILILVFTGDDDDDKRNKPVSVTEAETTTAENITTEEPDTEEPATDDITDIDYNYATFVVEDFMSALKNMNYDDCADYLYPGMIEYIEENSGMDASDVLDAYSWTFYDNNGDFFDYEVKAATEEDSDYFEEYEESGLSACDDYVKPVAYAECEVEFSYEEQASSVILHLGYIHGQFYILDFDDSNFEIILEEDSSNEEGTTPSAEDMASIIESMINDSTYDYSIVDSEYDGELANGVGGYTVKMPTGWTDVVNEANGYTYYHAPSGTTSFTLLTDTSFGSTDPVTYLTNFCTGLMSADVTVVNLGKLITPNCNGYYVVGHKKQYDNTDIYVITYMLVDSTGAVHHVAVNTADVTCDDAIIAEYVVASIVVQ